jgi:signal transduction histidine kinase
MLQKDRHDPIALVSVLGHELKNMLSTVVGFSELMLTQELPHEQQVEYLQLLRDEGLRATRFLHDMLDLERLESGSVAPRLRPTDVRELLAACVAVAAADPSHPVSLSCPSHLPPVLVEPDRVHQVLGNLIANARAYSPAGGPISLEARAWGAMVEVSVIDQGLGIPPEALPRVFDRFYRVDSPRHRRVRGTGLGLTISRQIVDAHGGYLWAESAGLGCGARFSFTLPVAPPRSWHDQRYVPGRRWQPPRTQPASAHPASFASSSSSTMTRPPNSWSASTSAAQVPRGRGSRIRRPWTRP